MLLITISISLFTIGRIIRIKIVAAAIAPRKIRIVETILGIFFFSRKLTTGFKRYDSSAAIKNGKIIFPRK
jgi:hypothetical protein